jgi:hypothetical protein
VAAIYGGEKVRYFSSHYLFEYLRVHLIDEELSHSRRRGYRSITVEGDGRCQPSVIDDDTEDPYEAASVQFTRFNVG